MHTADETRLSIPPSFGQVIGVEYSLDLSPDSWVDLGNFFRAEDRDDDWEFTDPDPVRRARAAGFFRAFQRPILQ